jgi:hypothetical protein
MKNINFSYEGAEYSITFTPKEDYSVHGMVLNDKEISIQVSLSRNYVRVYKVLDDVFSTEENLIHEEKLALNKVKASKFLEWYVKEADDYGLLGFKVYDILRDSGQITLRVEDLFNQSAFIPEKICEFRDDQAIGYRPNEILFEDDITLTDNQKMYYYERDSNR